MTGRERLRRALEHQPVDRPPIDLGATTVSGIAASTLSCLRHTLGLESRPVKVHEPFQMLGLVEDDVRKALSIDVAGLFAPVTKFGCRNDAWKPWKLQDGTDVLISAGFECTVDENGDVLAYPQGDRSARPSARMPRGGYYFDAIVRQEPLDESRLDPRQWSEQFSLLNDNDLEYLEKESRRLYEQTDWGIVGVFGQGGLGDISHVPGVGLKNPRGVRDPQLWYEYLLTHPDYIREIFRIQTDCALANLELYRQAVGDRIDVIYMSGTDFGTQRGLLISPDLFRSLWKPFYRRLNDWVHSHTKWKVFYHSCGAIAPLLDDLVEIGVDILNPVQCSAAGMEPHRLKSRYGAKLVFWGGGVDTQKTLPFGSPEDVRREVSERLQVLGMGGGFVFNPVHNIQHGTPVENIMAMFETVLGRQLAAGEAQRHR